MSVRVAFRRMNYQQRRQFTQKPKPKMSRYVEVTINGGAIPNPAAQGNTLTVPRFEVTLELEAGGQWRISQHCHAPPYVRAVLGYQMYGTYRDHNWVGSFELLDREGQEVLTLRATEQGGGPAFAALQLNGKYKGQYLLAGTWQASSGKTPVTWVGFAGKASGGAVFQGEIGAGALFSTMTGQSFLFGVSSGRLGAVGGFSGGLAFVMATGFNNPTEFHHFAADGLDWTLTLGTKASGLLKSSRLTALLETHDKVLVSIDQLMKHVHKNDLVRELHTVGKNLYSRYLIDVDAKSVTFFDIPLMSAGAEAGVYYAWSSFTVLGML